MKKSIKAFLAVFIVGVFAFSCKKKEATPLPTSYIFNGVKYTSVKTYVNTRYYSTGTGYYTALVDSAMNDNKTKAILFVMVFNKPNIPPAGNYTVYMPTGLPASIPNLITAQVYVGDKTVNHVSQFCTVSGSTQVALVTYSGKLKVIFPAMQFEGKEFDNSSNVVASFSPFSFTGFAFTEQ